MSEELGAKKSNMYYEIDIVIPKDCATTKAHFSLREVNLYQRSQIDDMVVYISVDEDTDHVKSFISIKETTSRGNSGLQSDEDGKKNDEEEKKTDEE